MGDRGIASHLLQRVRNMPRRYPYGDLGPLSQRAGKGKPVHFPIQAFEPEVCVINPDMPGGSLLLYPGIHMGMYHVMHQGIQFFRRYACPVVRDDESDIIP